MLIKLIDIGRYGRQTFSGLIKDGMSALSRYYLNNFHDGIRQVRVYYHFIIIILSLINDLSSQDALDLISGHYNINKDAPSPFQLNGFESLSVSTPACTSLLIDTKQLPFDIQSTTNTLQYLPVASVLIVGGLTVTTFTLNQGKINTSLLRIWSKNPSSNI